MSVTAYTKTGNKATSQPKLSQDVFGLEVTNHELLNYAYNAHLDNARSARAATLTRGKVRGGGRKPWRQKGTGRARAGSIRSPIWRGGGVTFGPQGNQNHQKPLTKKARQAALKQALSLVHQQGGLKIIDDFQPSEPKTRVAAELLKKLGAERRTLVVVAAKTEDAVRATNNLPDIKLVTATYLTVFDLLNAHAVIMTKDALKAVEAWLGDGNE